MRALCGDSTESTTECLARQTELLRRICLISQGGQELFCASLCFSTKSVIGAPVHSFGLIGEIFRHIRRASQLHANRLRSTEGAAVPSLALAIIRKLVAVPTSKDPTAIDDGYSARTASGGADEPDSFPSVVAPRAVQKDWILFILPILTVSLMPIAKDDAIELGAYADRSNRLPVP